MLRMLAVDIAVSVIVMQSWSPNSKSSTIFPLLLLPFVILFYFMAFIYI
jgi:hypothetical protein